MSVGLLEGLSRYFVPVLSGRAETAGSASRNFIFRHHNWSLEVIWGRYWQTASILRKKTESDTGGVSPQNSPGKGRGNRADCVFVTDRHSVVR